MTPYADPARARDYNTSYKRSWDRRHPDRARARVARYRQTPKGKAAVARAQANTRKAYPTRGRDRYLRKTFGISLADYEAMVRRQNGRCAICGDPMDPPHVDHDHETKKVRGMLCFGCNAGLGHFDDNPSLLELAMRYLEASR